jgi:hypothetical protein
VARQLPIPRAAPGQRERRGKGEVVTYTYEDILAMAQRVNWKIDDVIGGDKRLDFAKPFMPESLAGVRKLDFLSTDEQRTLNQIRGLGYLVMFGLV